MKKKLALMIVALVLVTVAVIGGAMAAFETGGVKANEVIELQDVGVALAATPFGASSDTTEPLVVMPGQVMELPDYYVVNEPGNGNNYSLYCRVTIDKQFVDDEELDASMIELLVSAESMNDWILFSDPDDTEQVIYYYRKPLEIGEKTSTFLSGVKFSEKMDNAYTDTKAVINLTIDAVQAPAASSSIPAEWGVYPTFAEDGTILTIEE